MRWYVLISNHVIDNSQLKQTNACQFFFLLKSYCLCDHAPHLRVHFSPPLILDISIVSRYGDHIRIQNRKLPSVIGKIRQGEIASILVISPKSIDGQE
jgi:hypothetical protein